MKNPHVLNTLKNFTISNQRLAACGLYPLYIHIRQILEVICIAYEKEKCNIVQKNSAKTPKTLLRALGKGRANNAMHWSRIQSALPHSLRFQSRHLGLVTSGAEAPQTFPCNGKGDFPIDLHSSFALHQVLWKGWIQSQVQRHLSPIWRETFVRTFVRPQEYERQL